MEKKNDINIYILSGIIVFVILIIVIIYSLVTNIGDDNEVNILEEVDYKSRSIEAYTNILKDLLVPDNSQNIFEKLDESFKNNEGITEDNIYNYLVNNGLVSSNIQIEDCNIFERNTYVVYRFKYDGFLPDRYVNLIETEPFNYTLSFDQSDFNNIIFEENIKYTSEYIELAIENSEVTDSTVKMNFRIYNISDNDIQINLNDIYTISLVLNNGETITQNSIVANENMNNYILKPNSNILVEASFDVSEGQQPNIVGILFRNISVNGENKDIEIKF